jgi:hypothetical protein
MLTFRHTDGIRLTLSKAIPVLSDDGRDQKSIETDVVIEAPRVSRSRQGDSEPRSCPPWRNYANAAGFKSLCFNFLGSHVGLSRVIDFCPVKGVNDFSSPILAFYFPPFDLGLSFHLAS